MKNELPKRILSSLIIIPITIFFIIKGSVIFIFFLSILFLATSYEWAIMSKKNNLLKFLGIIFLLFSFYTAFEFRENENYKDFLFTITICIFTDIGGYIFGKIFKGPKLTKISPKKTYSGMIGSYILSTIIVIFIFNKFIEVEKLIYFTIVASTLSQLGDLLISFLKRKAKLKDTALILPGHGGILDRMDGMIISIPLTSLIIKLI